ncbi:MAG: hypothetical protein ACLP1Y_08470 [Candidatus Acidiferrales bacterium]
MSQEQIQRAAVLAIAKEWHRTPFHMGACIKGAGVDCAQLLVAVYKAAGLVEASYSAPIYTSQLGLHQKAELYLAELRGLPCKEFAGPPQGADIVVVRHRLIYWHAGIVFDWPSRVLCAIPNCGVIYLDCERDPNVRRYARTYPPKFFTFWGDAL